MVVGGVIALLVAIMLAPQLNLQMNLFGAVLIVVFGFLFVTVSSRLTGEIGSSSNPISGMTVATLLLTCLIFLLVGWTGAALLRHRAVDRRHRLHRVVERRNDLAGSENRILVGSTPKYQQIAILVGALASGARPRPDSAEAERVRHRLRAALATRISPLPASFHANPADFENPDCERPPETRATRRRASGQRHLRVPGLSQNPRRERAGRTLPGQRPGGTPVYLVDPGINGIHDKRPDGSSVQKFAAPKATLMSYIIKGILSGQLPWGLVLLGVLISIVLEFPESLRSLLPSAFICRSPLRRQFRWAV